MTGRRKGMRGRMVMWCDGCKRYFGTSEESFRWTCPECGQYTAVMRCNRCGYTWRPRTGRVPETCPRCASPYWNRQRVLPKAGREE